MNVLAAIISDTQANRGVVFTQLYQTSGRPTLVLKRLARRFAKIYECLRTMEARIFRLRNEVVDAMAKFMKEGDHLVMLQQAGFRRCRFGEIAYQCVRWVLSSGVFPDKSLLLSAMGFTPRKVLTGRY